MASGFIQYRGVVVRAPEDPLQVIVYWLIQELGRELGAPRSLLDYLSELAVQPTTTGVTLDFDRPDLGQSIDVVEARLQTIRGRLNESPPLMRRELESIPIAANEGYRTWADEVDAGSFIAVLDIILDLLHR